MAKAKKNVEVADVDVGVDVAPEKTAGKNRILLQVDGVEIPRAEYIRSRWAEGATRGKIAKELSTLQGKEVPYQIVFAATKGVEGGPAKDAAAADEAGEE